MQLLETVYDGYPATLALGERVTASNIRADISAIREGLPAYFSTVIAGISGRNPAGYRIYGGVGQLNFNYAKVPWVAILDRKITTSTQRCHYVVLLFTQDMSGCFLSLNQGYTQYKKRFATDGIAQRRIAKNSLALADIIAAEEGWIKGPIDLSATHTMGKGYERGSILSKFYARDDQDIRALMASDLKELLGLHDKLGAIVGGTVVDFAPPPTETEFQSAAMDLAADDPESELPQGPIPVPAELSTGGGQRYRRNPNIAAVALRTADFTCEIDPGHSSFTSRKTGRNFVEAHHLVPLGEQTQFAFSLDVPENVIALCPNCHRLLHLARSEEKKPLLKRLYQGRAGGLATRGIEIPLPKLVQAYGRGIEEEI